MAVAAQNKRKTNHEPNEGDRNKLAIDYRLSTIDYRLILGVLVSVFAVTAYAADCKVNNPNIDGEYVGGCLHGLAHGKSKAKRWDTYEGEFKQDMPDGYGIYTSQLGNQYIGNFINNKFDGYGIHIILKNHDFIDNFVKSGHGAWHGDKYVIEGMFKDNNFEFPCNSPKNCKPDQAKGEAQIRRDQKAREEQYRRDAPARQARQLCEAQKQSCLASCPPYYAGKDTYAHHVCTSRCGDISCN